MINLLSLISNNLLYFVIIRVFAIFLNTSLLRKIEGNFFFIHTEKQRESSSHFLPMIGVTS